MLITKTKILQSSKLEGLEQEVNNYLLSCYEYVSDYNDRYFELIDIKFNFTDCVASAMIVYKTDYKIF